MCFRDRVVQREGFFPPSLSLSLSLSTCGSQSTSLQLILTGFVFPCRVSNGDWLAFSASQHPDRRVKTVLNFSFWRIFFADDMS